MIKRLEEIEGIMKGLSLLQYYIKFSSNKLGLHDINKACEPFFCELFNTLWDTNYKRLEYDEKNHPGIDLGDKKVGSSMQITTDGSKTKLRNTIEKFESHKLYKKYNRLIHFVVGEKHYTVKKSDEIRFEKVKHNIFVAERTINGDVYEIHIMDLMDLLLLIDEEKSKKISQVHKYISENINAQIEGYQRQLQQYKLEPDRLIPFTADTFIDYCGITNPTERNGLVKDIQKLAGNINELDENARRFLFCALAAYKNKNSAFRGAGIIVDPRVVQRRLGIEDSVLQTEIRLLIHEELVDVDTLEDEHMLRLNYYDSEGNDLMEDIYNFCLENERSLEKLILKPDFSQLD
ncbi:SMEK domain-containing protein [Bacillus tropicus]|uniref:SMEK domain-containing protein n=1 Tax=Bacillus tropicus TaxID=2026188 RepID=UPI001E433234|nr:SMEK domain-containing protein [Bacillus tropicus]MCC1487703.1 SMEK domain-containing protein [Bacillus tropicus]